MKSALVGLLAVVALGALPILFPGTVGGRVLFGVAIPGLALAILVAGTIFHVVRWVRTATPFRIPLTAGQQPTCLRFRTSPLGNPGGAWSVVGRVALDALLFRPLYRNTTVAASRHRISHQPARALWLFSLMFHWSLLFIGLRHLRFFSDPPPSFVKFLQGFDALPAWLFGDRFTASFTFNQVHLLSLLLLVALGYLVGRRIFTDRLRYLSQTSDYFVLFLLLGIALSGLALRHLWRTDLVDVRTVMLGLATFKPSIPATVNPVFYVHLFLVSVLAAYFPFSKLIHPIGLFFSPTLTMANTNRKRRHVDPRAGDLGAKGRSYEDYEREFAADLKAAGLPLDSDQPASGKEP